MATGYRFLQSWAELDLVAAATAIATRGVVFASLHVVMAFKPQLQDQIQLMFLKVIIFMKSGPRALPELNADIFINPHFLGMFDSYKVIFST